ncbi:hypothetical protein MLD38_014323 [Melastoma candidum]|uniref:Uncharacterized protein n=1 Tax=Melastoma candidum TaxID=119954 RepID=A0ACB9RDR1_9MYRT|nr:hypothetical protein MLD38_014323 [Melastoma candidum]
MRWPHMDLPMTPVPIQPIRVVAGEIGSRVDGDTAAAADMARGRMARRIDERAIRASVGDDNGISPYHNRAALIVRLLSPDSGKIPKPEK